MQDGASSGAGHHARTIGSGVEPPPGARSAAATPLDLLGPDGRAELVATLGASIRGALVGRIGTATGDDARRGVRLAAAGAFDAACDGWELAAAGPSWRVGATTTSAPAERGGVSGARTLGDALDLLVAIDGRSLRTALRAALVDPADVAVARFVGRTLDETVAERISGAWRDDAGMALHALEGGRPPLASRAASAGGGCCGSAADGLTTQPAYFLGIVMGDRASWEMARRIGVAVERSFSGLPAGTIIGDPEIAAAADAAAAEWNAITTNWTCRDVGKVWADGRGDPQPGDYRVTVAQTLADSLRSIQAAGAPDLVTVYEVLARTAATIGGESVRGRVNRDAAPPPGSQPGANASTEAGEETETAFNDGGRVTRCCWSRQRQRNEYCTPDGLPNGVPCPYRGPGDGDDPTFP